MTPFPGRLRRIVRAFTTDEIEALPPRHAARTDPALTVERTTTVRAPAPDYTDAAAAHARVFEWRTKSPTNEDVSVAACNHRAFCSQSSAIPAQIICE